MNNFKGVKVPKLKVKKPRTVKEAADEYAKYNTIFEDEYSNDVRAFIAGAKWASKRKAKK